VDDEIRVKIIGTRVDANDIVSYLPKILFNLPICGDIKQCFELSFHTLDQYEGQNSLEKNNHNYANWNSLG